PERTQDKSQTVETTQAKPIEASLNDPKPREAESIQPRQIEIEDGDSQLSQPRQIEIEDGDSHLSQPRQIEIEDEASAPIQPRQIEIEDEEVPASSARIESSPSPEKSPSIHQQAAQKPPPAIAFNATDREQLKARGIDPSTVEAQAAQALEQRQDLNGLATAVTAERLIDHFGKDFGNGVQVFEGNAYQMARTQEGTLKINALDGRGNILEFGSGRLQGNLSKADIAQFEKISGELDKAEARVAVKERSKPEPAKKEQMEMG
ncbi:MAG: hypothetical protein ACRDEA_23180, partial [Microcystaceae cyanobacterium]